MFGGRSESLEDPAVCQRAAGGAEWADGGEKRHTRRHRETRCVESGDTGMMETKAQLLNHENQITEEKTLSQREPSLSASPPEIRLSKQVPLSCRPLCLMFQMPNLRGFSDSALPWHA